jgi:chemotaxis protein methyltransferase WspC
MTLAAIEAAVRDRLGLDPASLGPAVLPRLVADRMRATGAATPEAYLGMLAVGSAEAAALAAELAVPETWFFRGGRQLFDKLAGFLADRAARGPASPARALSLPCSTGEEPYSLAVALHERLVPPDAYRIDGADLSARHLERAAAGRFPASSFREPGPDVRPPHFRHIKDHAGDRWELLPHLRRAVRFVSGNVTDPDFLADEPPYDLILCRNLFIYLTPDGRKRAMANLDRLLAADGWLCLTPAEADRLPPGKFTADGPTEFGLYRRADKAPSAEAGFGVRLGPDPSPGSPVKRESRPLPARRGEVFSPGVPVRDPSSPATPPRPDPWGEAGPRPRREPGEGVASAPPPPLAAARALADANRLSEAKAVCEALTAGPGAADAFALLGVVLQAEGKADAAADAFRKALYLAPDHAEALAHLVVLADRRGDAAQAAALRRRLARVTAREDAP